MGVGITMELEEAQELRDELNMLNKDAKDGWHIKQLIEQLELVLDNV